MYTYQALQILVFLIPGFTVSAILHSFIVRQEKKEIGKVVEALFFSLLVYSFYSLFFDRSPISIETTNEIIDYTYNGKAFITLSLITIALPCILSLIVSNDLHMSLARYLKITKRTSRNSVWLDVFMNCKQHIIINFENGRRIYGWPSYYSDSPKEPYIFLADPYWIEGEEITKIDVDGILITSEQKIESIEVLKAKL
jgi:hypothetical protein